MSVMIEALGYKPDEEYNRTLSAEGKDYETARGGKMWCAKCWLPMKIVSGYNPPGLDSRNLLFRCPNCQTEVFDGA